MRPSLRLIVFTISTAMTPKHCYFLSVLLIISIKPSFYSMLIAPHKQHLNALLGLFTFPFSTRVVLTMRYLVTSVAVLPIFGFVALDV